MVVSGMIRSDAAARPAPRRGTGCMRPTLALALLPLLLPLGLGGCVVPPPYVEPVYAPPPPVIYAPPPVVYAPPPRPPVVLYGTVPVYRSYPYGPRPYYGPQPYYGPRPYYPYRRW
jgi:hypothetical protein